eukprot:TRINITY_DN8196_c0_g1_i3.p1 TRINITY_DN8196_c0_g1~~TRINITY_DN8196_c0_g1_i3.p1  ORF type:complete len:270 (-),score=73.70 TRINITY_DN8196_c0_g1_i3:179-988(-)
MEAFRKNRGPWYKRYLNKGSVSNGITFVIMVIGVVLVAIWPRVTPFQFILAFGLFGFSGGVTNSMAVKMLFDRVPGLYGSGVIERRFREIQDTVKKVIMDTFFDKKYLAKYLHTKAGQMAESFDVEEKLRELLESDTVDAIIDQKLDELAQRPEGLWLSMHGVTTKELRPMIKPFILGMGSDVAPMLLKNFDPDKLLNIDKIRTEVDTLLTTKLQELKPSTVKKLLEDVMRVHLGWLIVWGNVFGGCIGLMTKALEVVFEYTDATEFRF